jgi:glycosyltransferase involved in cell wall biosynthesis
MDGHGLGSAYRAADMVVMLSARENFGMAAAEALTMGKPVLLSKDVGLAAEVSRVGAGRSVVPTIPNIEHVWSDMLSNGDLDAMGRRAREYAERDLSCRSVAEKMLARFEEIKCPRPNHELSVV